MRCVLASLIDYIYCGKENVTSEQTYSVYTTQTQKICYAVLMSVVSSSPYVSELNILRYSARRRSALTFFL
jgi:hypothetical protein